MKISISTRKVVHAFFWTIVVLAVANLMSDTIAYLLGSTEVFPLFNLGLDANIPTWYSSFSILICALLLFLVSVMKRDRGERYARHWAALALIFLLMSIDEVARIHETVAEAFGAAIVDQVPTITGNSLLFYSTWMIPGAIFVLVVGVLYFGFVLDLPPRTRLLFVVAGASYLLGAMGMEAVGAEITARSGGDVVGTASKVALALATTLEETLEMLGILIFLYALLGYVTKYLREISLKIED